MRGDFSITSKARSTKRTRIKKKLKWDERGALEGLPLYLIILVVITAVGIVIILAWLNPFMTRELQSISANPGSIDTDGGDIIIKAWDTKGNPLPDVQITFKGKYGAPSESKTTEADGTCKFKIPPLTFPPGTSDGVLTFEGVYSAGTVPLTKFCTVIVTRAS